MTRAKKVFLLTLLTFAVLFSAIGIMSLKTNTVSAAGTATVLILGNEISDGYYVFNSNTLTAVDEGDDWQIHMDTEAAELVFRNLNAETSSSGNFLNVSPDDGFKVVIENSSFGSGQNGILCSGGDTTIEVIGKNKITCGTNGICVVNGGFLKLEGDGSLDISGDVGIMMGSVGSSLNVSSDISICSDGVTLGLANRTAIRGGGFLNLKATNSDIVIRAQGSLIIQDVDFQIDNYSTNTEAFGIHSTGDVSITDSSIQVRCMSSAPDLFYGIYSEGDVSVTNGIISVVGSFESSKGVFCLGTATIDGGFIDYLSYAEKFDVISGNIIYDGTNYAAGEFTNSHLSGDVLVPENKTLIIPEGKTVIFDKTLKLSSGASVVNNGKMINNSTFILDSGAYIENNGEIVDNGVIIVEGAIHTHSLTKTCHYNGVKGEHCWESVCVGCPAGYIVTSTEPHDYIYTFSNNAIIESCSECEYVNTCTFDIESNYVYDGTAKALSVLGEFGGEVTLDFEYYRNVDGAYELISEADVVDAGEYSVKAFIQGKDEYYQSDFTISPKALTITGAYVDHKDYDGNASVYLNEVYFSGVVGSDYVTLGAEGAYVSSADAGYYDNVILTGLTVSGDDSANYTVDFSAEAPAYDYWGDKSALRIYPLSISINAEDQTVDLNGELDQTKWFIDEYYQLLEGHTVASVSLTGDTSTSTSFGTVIPEKAVIVDENGNDVTKNYSISYYGATLVVVCPDHDEFENGFCTACGGYEKPEVDPGENLEWDYDDVYLISNAGQLYWFADYVNNVNNNVSGKLVSNIIVNTTLDENARPWTPIGLFNSYRSYCGDFDGNGYTISGLYFKDAEASGVGLFGYTDYNYRVKNVGLENCYFEGKNYVGGLFGYASTEISNCFVGKDVTVIGEGNVGAFAGYLSSGTVSNCFAYAQTFAGSFYSDYVYIENCYYLSETETEDGGKTAEQFANGEVAFLLQAGILGEDIYDDDWNVIDTIIPEIWGQEIGVDALPVLGGEKVYSVTDCKGNQTYSNSNEVVHVDLNEYGYCEACQVKITGASISIGSSLTMNYHAEILDSSIIEEGYNVAMQFTMNGNTVIVYPPMYGAETQATLSTYNFAFEGIAPQSMASLIDAVLVLVDGDGNVVKSLASKTGYSVKENAEKILETYAYEEYLVQLVTDMLEYGTAAQEYRDFNTDNKANAGLEYLPSEKLPTADENVKEIITAEGVEIGNVYFISATVWFDNVNRIGVKLSTTENASLYVDGVKAQLDGTVYYTGAIYATEFGRVFTFELYDGEVLVQTLKYSVASYVYSMMNRTENGELTEMAKLARALYRYGFSTNAYRHFSERTECEFGEVTGYEWSKDFSICTAHGTCKYCNNEFSVTVNTALKNGEFVAVFENGVAGIQKKPISALSDLTGFTNEEVQSAVTLLLENGVTDVDITVDADTDMTYVSNAITSTDKTGITLKVSGVTSIGEGAFANNTQISSVSFPDVTTIGNQAFYFCMDIKKFDAPKLTALGDYSLMWCNSMEEINMPEVESIGTECFAYCESLKSIYFKKVTNVSDNAFEHCSSLEQVDMPELTQLNDYVFAYCESLKTVTFEEVTFVGYSAFAVCSSLENVNIPNLSSIDAYAFNGAGIKEISLPGVTSVGANAFSGCDKLEIVDIPKLTEVPYSAFRECTALTKISFPKALSIGENAFYRCSNLEIVDIPKAFSIGDSAFERCSSLIEAIFPHVTDVGNGAFSRCTGLIKAYFPVAISLGDSAFNICTSLIDAYFPEVIFAGDYAFANCSSLEEIRLDSAVSLGKYAFAGCNRLNIVYLPKATLIGDRCFLDSRPEQINLTAEGEITLGEDIFGGFSTDYTILVLNRNKDNGDNRREWNGYTFAGILYE